MKILIYGNRKQDNEYWDISTPEKEAAAYLAVFKILDEDWDVYHDLSSSHKKLYQQAKEGDTAAVRTLLRARAGYEYERVYEYTLKDATAARDSEKGD